jgi:kynurenine 3-monooxygenase
MSETIVVGGGLVGSLLSMFLSRRGHRVAVYDRMPDIRKSSPNSGRSINLTLCERGLKVLDCIGVGDAVRTLAVPVYGRLIHDVRGGLTFQPYGNRREAIYSIARADLNRVLLDYAEREFGIGFHFDERCRAVDLDSPSIETEHTATGRIATRKVERIFASDGAYSAVRMHMQKKIRLNLSQQYWEQGYKELSAPNGARGGWMDEKNVIHIWPRGSYMLIGFPNVDGSFTCSLHLPFEGPLSFDSIRDERALLDFFEAAFPDALAYMPRLTGEFFTHPVNTMVTIKCSPWSYRGKVSLIGDAAHSIFPSYGQGANAGFEDCAVLDECIGRHGDDWATLLREFEERRRPNTNAIADLCVEHFVELRDLVGTPDFLLRKEVERKLNEAYPEKYKDLYSMITFTCMPYTEALRIDREQRAIVERVMSVEGVGLKLGSFEVERLIDSLMAAVSAAPTDPSRSPTKVLSESAAS